jgi:hypothetical protein
LRFNRRGAARAATARNCIQPRSPRRCWRVIRRLAPRRSRARPTSGTGTTGVGQAPGRRFTGGGDAAYAAAAQSVSPRSSRCRALTLVPFMTAREAPRVPFATLLERGLVRRGAAGRLSKVKALRDARSRQARRRADPLHRRAGAGARSPQRWAFWHLETAKGLISITRCGRRSALRWRSRGGPAMP